MRSYHNTTAYSGQTLLDFEQSARTQDTEILAVLSENPRKMFTARQIEGILINPPMLQSIRRALTNLCKAEKIKRVDWYVEGYGRKVGLYQLK